MPRTTIAERVKRKAFNKNSTASITASRLNAIEQMNSALKRRFTMVELAVNDLRAENLKYYHKIGTICEAIRNSPEEYAGKDGTPGLKLIEQALSTQARTLRKAAVFARDYNADQLKELVGMVNNDTNFQLNWGHVSYLLILPTPEKRLKFAQEAVSKMLDPSALHELIKKKTQKTGGHGRKHEMPKTVPAQIRQILTINRQWVGKNTNVWNGIEESVFGNLMDMPPDDMEPDMVEQLQEAEALFQEVADAAASNVDKTKRAREYIAAAIAKREEQEAAAASSGRQTRAIDLDGDSSTGRRRGRRATAGAAT